LKSVQPQETDVVTSPTVESEIRENLTDDAAELEAVTGKACCHDRT
jgi:hypothetical protein